MNRPIIQLSLGDRALLLTKKKKNSLACLKQMKSVASLYSIRNSSFRKIAHVVSAKV